MVSGVEWHVAMDLNNLPIEKVDVKLLQMLISEKVEESKTVEYKSQLPSKADKDKREFLADVSSFANASGGYLFYGIEENGGVPTAIGGLGQINRDEEILRLENMALAGIEPRIPGLQTEYIATPEGPVIAMHIPRSWIPPHMVKFDGQRFFGRKSNGKYPLDVYEIRGLSLFSESMLEKTRRFRVERLMAVEARETPTALQDGACLVVHLVPVAAYAGEINLGVWIKPEDRELLHEATTGWSGERVNFDGFLLWGDLGNAGKSSSYVQLFRDGRIEAVDTFVLRSELIRHRNLDRRVLEIVGLLLQFLKGQGVPTPILISLSALEVQGFRFELDAHDVSNQIDRDRLIVPEIVMESHDADVPALLKPCLDAIWNAAGELRSPSYDEEGRWIGS